MKNLLILTLILGTIATSRLEAQTLTYQNVQTHNNPNYTHYFFTQQGNPVQGPYGFAFYTFHFTATNTTGTATALEGQDFIGFCINSMYPDPQNGDIADFSTGPSLLTYNLGTGDYWAQNRNIKWEAIRNTLAYYANDLRTLNPAHSDYADLVTGINIAFTEVIVDYDGTLASIDINSGNSIAKLNDQGDPITSGIPFDTYNYIRNNLIGTGNGGSFEVFAGSKDGDAFQDLGFIAVVPESSTAALSLTGLLTGFVLLQNRKRTKTD